MRASVGTTAVLVSAMLLPLLPACTWSAEEPGLFPAGSPPAPSSAPPPLSETNPDLPVLGETVWRSAEGVGVLTRFAVHAVRRIDGATVLDLSVTPLAAAGLARGERLPTSVDLGLDRDTGGDVNALLVDGPGKAVYRPLSHLERSEFNRCLCSPIWVAQQSLRIGETRMLQVTFPELPAAVDFVDVSLITLPMFVHVPVAPIGQAPTAAGPVDLSRPEERRRGGMLPPVEYRDPDVRERRSSVQVESVTASPYATSVRWTIRSLTDQPNVNVLPVGPPLAADLPPDVFVVNPDSAYGPQLRLDDDVVLKALFMTTRFSGRDFFECLCTDLGLWAAELRESGGAATVTTNYPPLSAGTDEVDVVLPEVGTILDVPVTAAPDAAKRVGPMAPVGEARTWTYRSATPPAGWSTQEWPTPVPDPGQLSQYEGFVEAVVRPPGW